MALNQNELFLYESFNMARNKIISYKYHIKLLSFLFLKNNYVYSFFMAIKIKLSLESLSTLTTHIWPKGRLNEPMVLFSSLK